MCFVGARRLGEDETMVGDRGSGSGTASLLGCVRQWTRWVVAAASTLYSVPPGPVVSVEAWAHDTSGSDGAKPASQLAFVVQIRRDKALSLQRGGQAPLGLGSTVGAPLCVLQNAVLALMAWARHSNRCCC